MNNQQQDGGNLIAAVLLCVMVLVGWQYFFVSPQLERQRNQAHTEQQQTPGATTPNTPAAAPAKTTVARDEALATGGQRIAFDNEKIDGSIRLTGGQIDDLRLKT